MSRQEVLENLEVYESMRDEFEAKHLHKWVVFADKQLVGIYDTNVEATTAALQRFGGAAVPDSRSPQDACSVAIVPHVRTGSCRSLTVALLTNRTV